LPHARYFWGLSGRGGIRTHGGLAPSTIFKIVAINLALPPFQTTKILIVERMKVLAVSVVDIVEHAVEISTREDLE
jgi:hypothetical protein